jgi:hypothetical protein
MEVPAKLEQVAQILHSTPDLYVVGPFSKPKSRFEFGKWREFVAPRERINSVSDLNQFTEKLATDLNPQQMFYANTSTDLISLGVLEHEDELTALPKPIKVVGETVVAPSKEVIDLLLFGQSTPTLLDVIGQHYDTAFFGMKKNEQRTTCASFISMGLNTITEGLLTGQIHPFEIRAMITNYLEANARMSENPRAMVLLYNFINTH